MCHSFAVCVSISISYQLHDHSYNIYIYYTYTCIFHSVSFWWNDSSFLAKMTIPMILLWPGLQMWSQRFLGAEFMWMVGLSCLGALGVAFHRCFQGFPCWWWCLPFSNVRMPPSCHKRFIFLTMSSPQGAWRSWLWCDAMSTASKNQGAHIFFDIFLGKVSVDFDRKLAVWSCDSGRPWLLFWKHGTQEAFLNAWWNPAVNVVEDHQIDEYLSDGLKTTKRDEIQNLLDTYIGHFINFSSLILQPRWRVCDTSHLIHIGFASRFIWKKGENKGRPRNGWLAKG